MNNYQHALLNGIHFYLKKFYNYPKKGMIFKILSLSEFITIGQPTLERCLVYIYLIY